MMIFWGILLVAFLIIEAATAQLVTIWFAAGSLAALIANLADAPILLQWIAFGVVTALTLAATRPLAKKLKKKPSLPMNADSIIGKKAIVTEEIDNLSSRGRVEINGMSWSARSVNEDIISEGTQVIIEHIEGVKLIVNIYKGE